jgi:hypothetical protein
MKYGKYHYPLADVRSPQIAPRQLLVDNANPALSVGGGGQERSRLPWHPAAYGTEVSKKLKTESSSFKPQYAP